MSDKDKEESINPKQQSNLHTEMRETYQDKRNMKPSRTKNAALSILNYSTSSMDSTTGWF